MDPLFFSRSSPLISARPTFGLVRLDSLEHALVWSCKFAAKCDHRTSFPVEVGVMSLLLPTRSGETFQVYVRDYEFQRLQETLFISAPTTYKAMHNLCWVRATQHALASSSRLRTETDESGLRRF
jgi:hypothetical protein